MAMKMFRQVTPDLSIVEAIQKANDYNDLTTSDLPSLENAESWLWVASDTSDDVSHLDYVLDWEKGVIYPYEDSLNCVNDDTLNLHRMF